MEIILHIDEGSVRAITLGLFTERGRSLREKRPTKRRRETGNKSVIKEIAEKTEKEKGETDKIRGEIDSQTGKRERKVRGSERERTYRKKIDTKRGRG